MSFLCEVTFLGYAGLEVGGGGLVARFVFHLQVKELLG